VNYLLNLKLPGMNNGDTIFVSFYQCQQCCTSLLANASEILTEHICYIQGVLKIAHNITSRDSTTK
jgi:hypothetical protein